MQGTTQLFFNNELVDLAGTTIVTSYMWTHAR